MAPTVLRFLIALVAALFLAGCGTSGEGSSAGSGKPRSASNPAENAAETNVPRVGPTGSVEVDDLRWSLTTCSQCSAPTGAYTARALDENGNTLLPDGVFVVALLTVANHKNESITLNAELVSLVAGGKTYKTDTEAVTAAPDAKLIASELGPSLSTVVQAIFDVAPEVLRQHPELRFNELGLGTTHGYIELPLATAATSTPTAHSATTANAQGGAAPVLSIGPVPDRKPCNSNVDTDLNDPDCPLAESTFAAVVAAYKATGQIPAQVVAVEPATGAKTTTSCDAQGDAAEYGNDEVACANGTGDATFTVSAVESASGSANKR